MLLLPRAPCKHYFWGLGIREIGAFADGDATLQQATRVSIALGVTVGGIRRTAEQVSFYTGGGWMVGRRHKGLRPSRLQPGGVRVAIGQYAFSQCLP